MPHGDVWRHGGIGGTFTTKRLADSSDERTQMTAQKNEWEYTGRIMDGVYSQCLHTPCSTTMYALDGSAPLCPKCQPEEWAALVAAVEKEKSVHCTG
jgi:hypothetical protein